MKPEMDSCKREMYIIDSACQLFAILKSIAAWCTRVYAHAHQSSWTRMLYLKAHTSCQRQWSVLPYMVLNGKQLWAGWSKSVKEVWSRNHHNVRHQFCCRTNAYGCTWCIWFLQIDRRVSNDIFDWIYFCKWMFGAILAWTQLSGTRIINTQ